MSAEGEEEAVIVFPIRFETEIEEGQEISDTPTDGLDSNAIEALTEFMETTDKQGLKTLSAFAKNPTGLVENELLGVLGRAGVHGALAVAIISAIIAAPEIIKAIAQALAVKGGPLNQDFHRFLAEEEQLGLDRNLQYRRATGLDVIITNENRGFLLQDEAFVNNSLVDIDKTRIIRLTDKDTKYGYVQGM